MNRPFSVYLDLVRFVAACLVYLYHSNQRFLIKEILPASTFGHSSVIVFFVLSGFVIAYVASTKEAEFARFAASRISRIFSVAVPAIVLTLLLDTFGRMINPEIYSGYPYDQIVTRLLGSLLMFNEIWFVSITSFSNVPYWSVGYEWWYYLGFALVTFLPRKIGLISMGGLMLLLGPKVILLAPIWWLGVLLYNWHALQNIARGTAWILAVGATLGIVLFHHYDCSAIAANWLVTLIGDEWHRQLTFSKFFISDYLLGILVFANFAGMRTLLSNGGGPLMAMARPVRYVAGFTFTLYLMHQPLFLFWGAVVRGDPNGPWYWTEVTTLLLATVVLISHFTEKKRFILRDALLELFQMFRPKERLARSLGWSGVTLPPCYVLGLETQIGLALVRELGRAGVPVIGIAQNHNAIGLRSRYLHARAVVMNLRSEQGIKALQALGERHGAGVLLAISEVNIAWLIKHRDELGKLHPLVPTSESFAYALDKTLAIEAARRVGITVPISQVPASWNEVECIANSFPFPGVLKWPAPGDIVETLEFHALPLIKAEHIHNPAEFLAASRRYAPMNDWPMLQKYCPGIGLGQFFYMHKGEAIRRFQHFRVAEWPPEGGFSSVCDALPLTSFVELQEQSIALLRSIGWEGVAMVEYRYDPAHDRAVLMEINGRFWGSFPLAVACNAGFGLLAYGLTSLGKAPDLPQPRDDLRCRMVITELKRLARILLQSKKIHDPHFVVQPIKEMSRFIADYFRPGVRYYVWSIDDPLPSLIDLWNAILRR